MPELPHPDWPLRFQTRADGSVAFAEVEQGTVAELEASAAVIAATPRGSHLGDPLFGVTTPLFEPVPVDAQRLARELAQSDPRLDLTARETADLLNATARTVRIAVRQPGAATDTTT